MFIVYIVLYYHILLMFIDPYLHFAVVFLLNAALSVFLFFFCLSRSQATLIDAACHFFGRRRRRGKDIEWARSFYNAVLCIDNVCQTYVCRWRQDR